jgi:hypothetical protein
MRPLYESGGNRDAEQEIARLLVERWHLSDVLKLTMAYGLDFALVRNGGDVEAFAEIKDRDLAFGTGDGYYLSLYKALKARAINGTTGMPCLLVVRFRGGSIWHAPFEGYTEGRLVKHGRADRADCFDIEPCVVFPWPAFKEVKPA